MNTSAEVLVVYDKECPACDYYCNMVRIKDRKSTRLNSSH